MGIALITNNILSDSGTAIAGLVPTSRTISTTAPLTGGGDLSADRTIAIPAATSLVNGYLTSADWTTFNAKQAAGNYITSLTGEATATGPGAAAVTLNNASVTGKVLTGVNITGGSVLATDTMLTAFGKLQNQINGLIGSTIYQGVWNATTNTPTLASGVGTRGYYYIVNVAGNTNLNGITDWQIGDWAIFDGTAWQKVDNTESVTSVNGFTGAVSLTTDNIAEGTTNLYFSNARARSAVSLTTTGSSGAATYNNTTGVFNIPNYGTVLANYLPLTGGTLTGGLVINPANTAIIGLDVASNTVTLRSDSTNPFARQLTTTMSSGTLIKMQAAGYGGTYVTDLGFYTSTSSAVNTTPNLYLTGGDNRVGINTITPDYVLDVVGTAGVSGQLTLGSTITNGTYTYTLPGATGTLALTSQIPSVTGYVPYTGATQAVNLGAYDLTVNSIRVGKGAGSISDNTVVGSIALGANTTGSGNTAIGYAASNANTTAGNNTSMGYFALAGTTTGGNNTAIGSGALTANSTGIFNTGIGKDVLASNTTGQNNVAVGPQALYSNSTASNNTAFGYQALFYNTGANNTAVGKGAGINLTTGNNNTIIGGYFGDAAMASNVVLSDGAGNIRFQYNGTNTLLGQSGNVGIGVTPSAWGTPFVITEYPYGSYVGGTTTGGTVLGNNNYYNGTSYIYKNSDYASQYNQSGGNHIFRVATTGTAGNVITWTTAMTILSGGNVGIGNTSPLTKLVVATASNVNFEVRNGADYGLTGVGIDSRDDTRSTRNAMFIYGSPIVMGGGNVLINTTTDAGYKLDVNGTGRFSGQLTASTTVGGTSAIFQNTGAQNANGIELRGGTGGTAVNWKIEKDNTVGNAFQLTPSTTNGGTTYTTPVLTIASTGVATFSSSITATSLSISSTANATNPASGSIVSAGGLGLGGDIYIHPFNANQSNYAYFKTSATTVNTLTLTIGTTYGFGVGVDALSIYNGAVTFSSNIRATQATLSNGNLTVFTSGGNESYSSQINTVYNYPYVDSYFDAVAGASYEGRLNFRTSTGGGSLSTKMTIYNSGNVLIGTTTDLGSKLQVLGDIAAVGTNPGLLSRANSNATTYGFYNNGNGEFILTNSGVANVGRFNMSTGNYTALSDQNKKKDIELSNIGLSEVMKLKPSLYRMKEDQSNGQKELGFIAQDVKQIIPNAYVESTDFIGLNFNPIVAALTKAVQELKAELDTLKNK